MQHSLQRGTLARPTSAAGAHRSHRLGVVPKAASTIAQDAAAASASAVPSSVAAAAAAAGCPVFRRLSTPLPAKPPLQAAMDKLAGLAMMVQATVTGPPKDPLVRQTASLDGKPLARGQLLTFDTTIMGNARLGKAVLGGGADFSVNLPRRNATFGRQSVLSLDGDAHARLRGLMATAFSADEIEKYTPAVQALATKHLDDIAAASAAASPADPSTWPRGAELFELFTLGIICRLVAGIELSDADLAAVRADFGTFLTGLGAPLDLDLPFLPYGQSMAARRRLVARIDVWITASRTRVAAGAPHTGVLDELVAFRGEDGQQLTTEQLQDNMITFLVAGFDTTAATISAAVDFLHKHPEQLAQLEREQAAVVAQHGQRMTSRSLRAMKGTERFVKETLRLRPVVPSLARLVTADLETTQAAGAGAGAALQRGELAVVPLRYISAHDPQWAGKDIDAFNPDRWLEKGAGGSGAWMPFGAGPHICLGMALAMMEARVMLATLVRDYDVVDVAPTEWQYTPLLSAHNALPLRLRRKAAAAADADADSVVADRTAEVQA